MRPPRARPRRAGAPTASFTLSANHTGHFTNSPHDPSPDAGNFANVFVIHDHSVVYSQYEIWLNRAEAILEQSNETTIAFDLNPGDTISVYVQAWSTT